MQLATMTIEPVSIDGWHYLGAPVILFLVSLALLTVGLFLLIVWLLWRQRSIGRAALITAGLLVVSFAVALPWFMAQYDQLAGAAADQLKDHQVTAMEQHGFTNVSITTATGQDDHNYTTYTAQLNGRTVHGNLTRINATTYQADIS